MLNNIIGALSISVVNILNWSKLQDKTVNFKDCRLYIGAIIMTILIIINFFSVNSLVKSLMVIVISTFAIIYIYKSSLREAIIMASVNQIAYIICDILFVIVALFITNIQKNEQLVEMFFGTVFANIVISLSVYGIMHSSFVYKLYKKIIQLTKKENVKNTIIVVFTISGTASIVFNLIFFTNDLLLLSCGGLAIVFIYLIIIIKSIKVRNNYLNMHIKYNSTLETLKSYEDIMDKYKVSNHENKNQLLMIRNMLKKDTKNEVSKYIDKIVENEYKDDEHLMMETSKIPSGGLRALIYSKLLYMKNNKIDFDLKVDRKIRNIEFSDSDQELILDICKIVGVFLDNSIEAVKLLRNGSVSIELYMLDEKFNISIANNFEGGIELDKIDEERYTTKGNGHGYGLSLVKTIINKNRKLENTRMINDDVFVQILKIEI